MNRVFYDMYITTRRYGKKMNGTIVGNVNRGSYNRDFTKKNEISYESKRQAFKRASDLLFFNEDMVFFLTLTYRKQHSDYNKILNDLKNFVKKEKGLKYIGVVEKHKSGNYHIHLITSEIKTVSHRAGKLSAVNWKAGFSDVVHINSFDDNFNILKYLFKYLQKGEKIGGRWVLKSRNLNKPVSMSRHATYKYTHQFLLNLMENGFTIDKKEIIAHNGSTQLLVKFNN